MMANLELVGLLENAIMLDSWGFCILVLSCLPRFEKGGKNHPNFWAAEVWRFKWFMLSVPCSDPTNRKFPQSFHHRKFPVRKALLHKQGVPQLSPQKLQRQLKQCGQKGVGVNRVRRQQGAQGWTVWEEMEETKKLFHFLWPWICQKIAY